uniref:Uncharacterized protein n=1 Tax=viral metagenome TaxID=1070528 RepID=A0A6H2A4M1_9ZZZZ
MSVLQVLGIAVLIITILTVPVYLSNKKARQMDDSKFRCQIVGMRKGKKK